MGSCTSMPQSDIENTIPLPSRHTATNRIDFQTEFESNIRVDRLALYLRPLDANGQALYVPGATESQKRWGGLHATLCSFAPERGARGASVEHLSLLADVLEHAYSAAAAIAKPGAQRWRLRSTALLPAENNMLWLSPTASGDSHTLKVISQVVASAGLLNARPAESLHISIGSADASLARVALLDAPRWELAIAKCSAGTERLQVTEFVMSKELAW